MAKIYDQKRLSKCCKAPVWIGGDNHGHDDGTHYYRCNECGSACNTILKPSKPSKGHIARIVATAVVLMTIVILYLVTNGLI